MPFDPVEKRTEGTIQNADGSITKISKGAPHIIVGLLSEEEHEMHEVSARAIQLQYADARWNTVIISRRG
jgi:magnesium-transporting ATPase (P-type)